MEKLEWIAQSLDISSSEHFGMQPVPLIWKRLFRKNIYLLWSGVHILLDIQSVGIMQINEIRRSGKGSMGTSTTEETTGM